MANLYVTVDQATDIKKSVDASMVSVSNIKKSTEAEVVSILSSRESRVARVAPVVSTRDSRTESLRVQEKAADDPNFIARLTYEGSNARREYDFTMEEKVAFARRHQVDRSLCRSA